MDDLVRAVVRLDGAHLMGSVDYTRLCLRHQWASAAMATRDLVAMCPFCLVELDGDPGRTRYRQLHGDRAQQRG